MKALLLYTFFMATGGLLFAQDKAPVQVTINTGKPGSNTVVSICTPSRAASLANAPLYMIKSHKQEIKTSVNALNAIDPKWIKTINVTKDSATIANYGTQAKNGIVVVVLDDDKFPNAFAAWQEAVKKQ
jgi:ribosomal protein L23